MPFGTASFKKPASNRLHPNTTSNAILVKTQRACNSCLGPVGIRDWNPRAPAQPAPAVARRGTRGPRLGQHRFPQTRFHRRTAPLGSIEDCAALHQGRSRGANRNPAGFRQAISCARSGKRRFGRRRPADPKTRGASGTAASGRDCPRIGPGHPPRHRTEPEMAPDPMAHLSRLPLGGMLAGEPDPARDGAHRGWHGCRLGVAADRHRPVDGARKRPHPSRTLLGADSVSLGTPDQPPLGEATGACPPPRALRSARASGSQDGASCSPRAPTGCRSPAPAGAGRDRPQACR